MRRFDILSVLLFSVFAGCNETAAQPKKAKETIKGVYPQMVAGAFLATLRSDANAEQLALTDKAFQERHKETGGILGGWSGYRFMPMYERDFGYLDALLDRNQQTGPAENTELDCDKSEWIFTGTVEPAVPGPGNIPGTYYVRVVKDNGGKWRVDFFTVEKQDGRPSSPWVIPSR